MSTTLKPPPARTGYTYSLIDPALFDFWAARLNPLWTWARPLARIVARRPAGEGAVTLSLRPNRHVGEVRPGQHLNIGAEMDGHRITRSYSLSAPVGADGLLQITVQAVEHGKLSQYLNREARVGEILSVSPAFGEMTLPAQPRGRWLMLAAGSGVTPFLSLAPALLAADPQATLTLLVWARTRARCLEAAALQALAAAHPRLTLRFVLTREASLQPGEAAGRLSAERLPALLGEAATPDALAATQVMACGPGDFVASAQQLLQGRVASLKTEAFSLPTLADDATGAAPVQLTLRRSGQTLTVPGDQSLLVALEAQGFKPAFGCRMGICHTCVCTRVEGATQDLQTGALDAEPLSTVRLCVSRPRTHLTLDL